LRWLDLGFALALIVAGVMAAATWSGDPRPDMPAGVCLDDRFQLARPRRIAALIGQIEPGEPAHDPAMQSVRFLEQALVDRGFRRTGSRFTREALIVDLLGPPSLPFEEVPATGAAIEHALREHDLVYYNGHSYDGALRFAIPADRVLVLDACWSAQLYGEALAGSTVVANSERAVTGSVETLLHVIDGHPIAAINASAIARALRRGSTKFPTAERYGRLAGCGPT
jgi:hypothetical protein